MASIDDPVTFVVPGDLHLIDSGLDNDHAALGLVDEINTLIRPDFVQFIGDNVQDATETQFQLFDDLRQRLDAPHHALVGDHDVKDDPEAKRFRTRLGETFGSTSIQGFRFLRLNSQQHQPMGFGDAQIEWATHEADAAIAMGERIVIFQHNFPYQIWENFDGPGVDRWRAFVQTRRIEGIICGHTHYWQVVNDGRNAMIAVRSVGDPEGGSPGYLVGHLAGDDFAAVYRTVDDKGPLVMITHPRELILATTPAHVVTGRDRIEARVWSSSAIQRLAARVDHGTWLTLEHRHRNCWETNLDSGQLAKGIHRIEIQAIDCDGREARQVIEFAVDPTGRFTATPRTVPIVYETAFC